ncbi:uncharacterized protein B0I36DRAFT_313855 [Microdochium trichocladiopsis]|uniref:MYND-type domain-containing protein n=1 Tax=Microdochium trichocladiopsis TaxID=1682393 RepID=A0A9P8YAZ8_9PEZI|nr:uncharacterized protein B0I36DRAFT_313855 [Microdochium trichocladiopsis]KAH7037351.1 hypothetical protein B0I36DRAFT_313855 [Microdochium trichocladiopsis]
MMRAGAKIRAHDMEHLRELVDKIPSRPRYSLPHLDSGFRDPGKVQFLVALENYKAGTPRSFADPSCYKCGKMQVDTGNALKQCAGCKKVWYCDRDCQKGHWADHKAACARSKRSANV